MLSIAKLPKYEAYKPSGSEWLGPVPAAWDITRLKNATFGCVNGLWGSDPKGRDELVVIRVADFDEEKILVSEKKLTYRSIPKKERVGRLLKLGDLLIEKSGGGDKTLVGRVVLFDKSYPAVTSNFVAKMTPQEWVDSSFLKYAFHCLYSVGANYLSIKQTTGIQNLDAGSYLNELFCFPLKVEQKLIAKFLDKKTTKIDEAIAIKEQQIALLKERKQIIIQKAVTQGLDPTVPMKDSGVDWIGEIPAHWEIEANRSLFSERVEPGRDGLPLLSVSIHSGVSADEVSEEDNVRGRVKIQDKSKYVLVKRGDVAFNMMRAWQGGIGAVSTDGMVSPAYIVAQPKSKILADFFEFQYRCPEFVQQMDRYSKGITDFRKRLYWDSFKQLNTVVPPKSEQIEIIEYIQDVTTATDAASELLAEQIGKLKEYKTTLINSAVTGKIRITPDMVEA